MFVQRALVSLTLGPLALWLIYQGGLFYAIPISVILLLATLEYAQIVNKMGYAVPRVLLVAVVSLQWVAGYATAVNLEGLLFLAALFVIMAYSLWLHERRGSQQALNTWLGLLFGVVLLGWLGSHFLRLRGLEQQAWQWTMLAMLSTWTADSGAYLVGRFLAGRVLGRHLLTPRLSPNKTIEGLFGGIVLGTLFTLGFGVLLQLPWGSVLTFGLLITCLTPMGDLGISYLKRLAGVKDSGTLFPGHGGALDRIDSLVWAVAIAYYLALYMG